MALINGALKTAGSIGKYAVPAVLVAQGVSTAMEDRRQGHSIPYSIGHAFVDTAVQNALFWPMLALQAAPLAMQINQGIQNKIGEQQRGLMRMSPYKNQDSEYAQTTRQRALEAIQNDRARATGYVGREAGLFATRYR